MQGGGGCTKLVCAKTPKGVRCADTTGGIHYGLFNASAKDKLTLFILNQDND